MLPSSWSLQIQKPLNNVRREKSTGEEGRLEDPVWFLPIWLPVWKSCSFARMSAHGKGQFLRMMPNCNEMKNSGGGVELQKAQQWGEKKEKSISFCYWLNSYISQNALFVPLLLTLRGCGIVTVWLLHLCSVPDFNRWESCATHFLSLGILAESVWMQQAKTIAS